MDLTLDELKLLALAVVEFAKLLPEEHAMRTPLAIVWQKLDREADARS